jgi:integrase
MATGPRDRLEREKETIRSLAADGPISTGGRDVLLKYATAVDPDTVRHSYQVDGETRTHSPRTIEGYLQCLRIASEDGFDLLEDSADEFNDLMARMHDEQGKSKSTCLRYQCAAQAFYRYHDDLGVDPDDIETFTPDSSSKHDELDMFTDDEVTALRRACGESNMHTRNRALLELLIFTGQRINALLTLRVKDVDVEAGYIYLNDEYADEQGGLKGALRRGRKRPMFGARKYVRDWIQYHPEGDDPEAWLFIGNPNHWKTDPDDHWATVSADHVLRRIGDAAGVDKPVNAHNFRHYAATVLYRDYDVDGDTIRMLFGHVKGSSALEDTYSHLFDEDYIHKAEEALGFREEESASTFTPDTCPTCGEILQDHWRQCPSCQEVFGPTEDFEELLDEAADAATDEAIDADDADEIRAYKAIIEAVDDPERLAHELSTLNG